MRLLILFIMVCSCLNSISQLPSSDWTIQIGGSGDQEGNDLVYDMDGNLYVIGVFFDTVDFDPGPAENILISSSYNSGFVAKYDSSGNYVWAKQFEGDGYEHPMSIAVDNSSNVYIGGYFSGDSIDLDPGLPAHVFYTQGDGDIFIVKLSSAGNLIWAEQFAGTGAEYLSSITLDTQANLYATGHFQNTVDFDPSPDDSTLTGGGMFNSSMFILKLDSALNFIWVDQVTSSNWVSGYSICLKDSLIIITGDLDGTADFDPGVGSFNLVGSGLENVFLLKIDTAGMFNNAISISSNNVIDNHAVVIDTAFNVIISGLISGSGEFDPVSTAGDYFDVDLVGDLYIAKYDLDFNFIWLVGAGSSTATSRAFAVETDSAGNIYSTGYFGGLVDFDPGSGQVEISADTGAIFLLKLDQNGNYLDVEQIGTGGFEEGRSLALDTHGEIAMTGRFFGSTDMSLKVPMTTVDFYADAFVHQRSHTTDNSGVIENENQPSVFIYPNPTVGVSQLNIEETSSVEVYTLTGQKIREIKNAKGIIMIDLSQVEPGVYIIKISSHQSSSTLRVVRL
ncbi:MAG: T9SS type A sorting domain-containing protein [Crocinitomicaceae bacterium]|nr:T9SS type A sorting domain-containing protein [Crocinitomicaceae bacterium]MBK8927757.1 T9SS type A sorting domain-containing protein [Crocinitomicaceae bacterium]